MFRFLLSKRTVFPFPSLFVQSCCSPAFENNMGTTETVGKFCPTFNETMILGFKQKALNRANENICSSMCRQMCKTDTT